MFEHFFNNHRQILAIFYISQMRGRSVGGRPAKLKNIFEKILGRECMLWQSFVQAGLG
jgi:hypothetical protein